MFQISRTPLRTLPADYLWPASFLRTLSNDTPTTTPWTPAIDILESEQAFQLVADLPGVAKGDLAIHVEKNVLTLSGERQLAAAEGQAWQRRERTSGKFHRAFTLPSGIDSEAIQANFDNGVLTLTVPKKQEARSRQIEIQ